MIEKEFRTTSFHVAAWLMVNNIKLEDIDWSKDSRRAEFVFKDFKDRESLVDKFFEEELLQGFISTTQELKARMYAGHSPIRYDRK